MNGSSETTGRLDMLILRLVELGCQKLQAKTGLDWWKGAAGQSGLKVITNDLIDHFEIPRVAIDIPRTLASGLAGLGEGGSAVPKRRRPSGTRFALASRRRRGLRAGAHGL